MLRCWVRMKVYKNILLSCSCTASVRLRYAVPYLYNNTDHRLDPFPPFLSGMGWNVAERVPIQWCAQTLPGLALE